MIYRIVGFLTGLGTLLFFGLVVVAMIAPTKPQMTVYAFYFAIGTILLGLVSMTWHVIFVQRSDGTKKEWRTFLIYFGPLAAAAYLWEVAPQGHDATSGDTIRRVPSSGPALQSMRFLGVVTVSTMAGLMTWMANRMLTPFEQLSDPAEAFLNYVLRIGFVISAAVLGSVLRLSFWPWIAVLILPSLIGIYSATGPLEIRVALLVAAVFLAWILSHLAKRGLSAEV